jgi:hypothetical protein
MGKKFLVVTGWYLGSLLTFLVCFLTLTFIHHTQILSYTSGTNPTPANLRVLSFLRAPDVKGTTTNIESADARPILISEFLAKNQSPLTPYDYWGNYLTQLADQYNLDYRLLPAIAMQESNLCKKIPSGSYNCLGLGIHARGTWDFPSFESNFAKAAEVLRDKYLDKGLITPDEIQDKYTPSSNGSWEFGVNSFMSKLETADW